jgi:predicted RNA binding protein YcfA (HicA-like mRNA interferase family)
MGRHPVPALAGQPLPTTATSSLQGAVNNWYMGTRNEPREVRSPAMPRAPRITGREALRALKRLGWREVAQRGSHVQLEHPERSWKVTIPVHAGETLDPKLIASMLRHAGLTVEQLRDAL